MKVFISWSGEKSKAVALLLKTWLPSVIQALDDPWVSDVDIESGANWSTAIGTQLANADFGIICVTQENQSRPWLNFEAGAISKLVGGAAPLLVDFPSTSELAGPMSQLQVNMPDRDGVLKLLKSINARLPKPLDAKVLEATFERSFGEFSDALSKMQSDGRFDRAPHPRGEQDKIDEILNVVRELGRRNSRMLNLAAANANIIAAQRERNERAHGAVRFGDLAIPAIRAANTVGIASEDVAVENTAEGNIRLVLPGDRYITPANLKKLMNALVEAAPDRGIEEPRYEIAGTNAPKEGEINELRDSVATSDDGKDGDE